VSYESWGLGGINYYGGNSLRIYRQRDVVITLSIAMGFGLHIDVCWCCALMSPGTEIVGKTLEVWVYGSPPSHGSSGGASVGCGAKPPQAEL